MQLEILRKLSPAQKGTLAGELTQALFEGRMVNLRQEHPDWSEPQLRRRFLEILHGPELAARVYPWDSESRSASGGTW